MNDKDKEAFEEWYKTQDRAGVFGNDDTLYVDQAWDAACQYKQKEIDNAAKDHIEKLQTENAKLRENINGTRMKQMNEVIEQLKAENARLREDVKVNGNFYKLIQRNRKQMTDQDKEAFQEWNNLPVDQILVPEKYREWVDSGEDTLDYFIEIAWQAGCRHKQKEIDHLSNCIEQIGKRLFPFSGYTEISKILEEIKAINEIYKQNAKPESN